jgi:PAS domain S-box-containing protein
MQIRWWPRSIRWQMLAGLVLLEALSIGLFAAILIQQQSREVRGHRLQRLAHQATSMSLQAREALVQQRPLWVGLSVKMMGESPSVAVAKVTDQQGNVLFISRGSAEQTQLDPEERAQIALLAENEKSGDQPRVFTVGHDRWEGVRAIYTGAGTAQQLRGFAWVETDRGWDDQQLETVRSGTAIFGIIWISASVLLVLLMARSITIPLAILHRGTTSLMASPESDGRFPLPVPVENELGDMIVAFNRMVASIAEQRAGLNDTLSLLDSMLANAPIGLAFFDSKCRFVRVNQVFADMTGVSLPHHLGRTLSELMPQPAARELEDAVERVFAGEPVRNFEFSGQSGEPPRPFTWIVSAYPVRTTPQQIRWVGAIVLDASERKRNEEALRKTEKLAATGRLAASIAHEVNNPLEAITNLLFLLSNYCDLEGSALKYVTMAEYEAKRIAEITQQTLRFYRQPNLPGRARVGELLDSALNLYVGKLSSLSVSIVRDYDGEIDLFCFAGELRQVFANLFGNSLDALPSGGRLVIRACHSHSWVKPHRKGIRFTIADTGSGMPPEVRKRAFEAFFTTKEVTGTGLGLWVSQEIIARHQGTLRVRSRAASPGKASGTVFQIFIPDDSDPSPSPSLSG